MNLNRDVYSLCMENSELKDFLIMKGFDNLKNPAAFKLMAKMIKLKDALKLKGISAELFVEEYERYIGKFEMQEEILNNNTAKYTVAGAVPCPIRVPLIDLLNDYNEKNDISNIKYDFRSANLGLDFVIDNLKSGKDLPDLITSAGYELILNKEISNRIESEYYVPEIEFNSEILERIENIKDPENRFNIIAIVPAVFIVNKRELAGRQIPKSWSDVLSEEYAQSMTIPVGDLDLYNALVLTIYSKYGEDGLMKLKNAVASSMHPSQMVNGIRNKTACVSVAPYFFASLVQSDELEVIWPEDGAIVSPIFMSVKKGSAEYIKATLNYLLSEEVGSVFSNNGKFPVTTNNLKNQFSKEQKLIFAGWELLNNIDEHIEIINKYFKLGD